jgi:hypothetical protein
MSGSPEDRRNDAILFSYERRMKLKIGLKYITVRLFIEEPFTSKAWLARKAGISPLTIDTNETE